MDCFGSFEEEASGRRVWRGRWVETSFERAIGFGGEVGLIGSVFGEPKHRDRGAAE